jgi:diguanylate cyclase (GGDEF)-like protein/PAS domain S-box-containing protein
LFGIARDITASKLAELATTEALNRLEKIASRVPGLVYQFRLHHDGSACLPYASEAILDIFRLKSDEVHEDASKVFSTVHPDDLDGLISTIQQSAAELSLWHHEFRVKYNDGTVRWLLGNSMPEREAEGTTLWNGFITDITDQKKSEDELNIAAIAFESQEGMLVTDANKNILRVNMAFTSITGYTADEVIGKNPRLLNSHRHDAEFFKSMWEQIEQTSSWEGEIWNRRKNGEVYPEHLTITAVKNKSGLVTNYVAALTDITSHKAASEKIYNLAFYDPLTRLPNRRILLDRLSQALAASARSGQLGALLFLDLDHFKTLNDTLGHDVGDLLLQQVAERLKTCVREGDTVARLGGDEFVLLLENLSLHPIEAATQSEVVGNKILASLNMPYQLALHQYSCTSSIGATIFNGHALVMDELLKQADIAMYQSKASGRNALSFFDRKMQEAITTRVAMETDLRNAIEQQQFQLHYQVQVDSDGKAFGAEALIRWLHPNGMIFPGEFIALAEETGLVIPIGRWVLETACAQLKAWQTNAHTRHLSLSVNVSAKQFRQIDFVEQVQSIVQHYGVNPTLLKLELTETMLLEHIDEIIVAMNVLKDIGIKFELDDFGTGYSSLQYLKKLPLYQLKIDQTFVHDLDSSSHDRSIVRTIIAMAHSLELHATAEGV